MDCTYHCQNASRLPLLQMDPSVAAVSISTRVYAKNKKLFILFLSPVVLPLSS